MVSNVLLVFQKCHTEDQQTVIPRANLNVIARSAATRQSNNQEIASLWLAMAGKNIE